MSHQLHNRFMALMGGSGELLYIRLPKMLAEPHWTLEQREQLSKFADSLKSIEEEAKRGADIVKTLVRYARITPDAQLLHLFEIVQSALGMLRYKIDFSTFDFNCQIPEDLPRVRGNFSHLQEVFFNLSDNAYDAIKKKEEEMAMGRLLTQNYRGFIRITTLHLPEVRKLKILVEDSGIGMTKEELAQLFIPFFTTKATAGKGTGLGLYVIKKIVETHGGTIDVTSTYDLGTTFTIHLPVAVE